MRARRVKLVVLWLLVLGIAGMGFGASAASRSRASRAKGPAVEKRLVVRAQNPETAPTRVIEGEVRIGANDLARLLGATKFWRSDVRKLVLRAGNHRIQLTVDNPFVLIDDSTIRLPAAVLSRAGELQIPVALVDSLPQESALARLLYDPGRNVVIQVPASGVVGTPQIAIDADGTRLWFPVDGSTEVVVLSRSRAHFRVRFDGFFVGSLPDTLPEASLVRAVRTISTVTGSGFELDLVPWSEGYRVVREPSAGRVGLLFRDRADESLDAFARQGPPGPRPLRVVVLDPGHGGSDAGVSVEGAVEKDLTLALAMLLRDEIARRLSARVVLTRDDDRDLSVDERAQRANRVRADLVLSLHFDGFGSPQARGVTAYCPPAVPGSAGLSPPAATEASPLLLSWRDVAIRHAVASRELAEDVLAALELRAQGPTRLREVLPYTLLGVNAPGLMIECATLTFQADRARVTQRPGLAELAATIVDGLEAYGRGE